MEIIRRHVLRKSDFKELKEKLRKTVGESADALFEKSAELIVTDQGELYAENRIILAFKLNEEVFPSLRALNNDLAKLPTITVDMGAVPYITNGADVMAPGITDVTNGLPEGTIVTIIDENFGKALAIGRLLFDSDQIAESKKGKVIKNIHYVNDSIWSMSL
ncbi:MAG: DUF1947 domain-containing protein [Asgard group archaeon]|nr:DUF1947 domain-containing protein [Asgard group archaeon]